MTGKGWNPTLKALILNSGLGSRMGALTKEHPKCMTEIAPGETIVSRQLKLLAEAGIEEIVMTTGYYDEVLTEYCRGLGLPLRFTFVKNPDYSRTNYIYSIYCAREYLEDDILLLHGDLVFDREVVRAAMEYPGSCMAVSATLPLPEKDFKARLEGGKVMAVGVDIFDRAVEAQAFYRLRREDWALWLGKIAEFCESGNTKVYAENALNALEGRANIFALDVGDQLCTEIDNEEDLRKVRGLLG